MATGDSDVGLVKETNQDSLIIRHAMAPQGEVLMAVVCDGLGGLDSGELASATVVKAFADWFESELPYELENPDVQVIGAKWSLMLKELNMKIGEKAAEKRSSIGTTFTGILFLDNKYVFAHVGDTRIYFIDDGITQLTEDQTFIAREIKNGRMTPEQAKTDKRRNVLLQCVGASKTIEPQVEFGDVSQGVYLLCSDGFRHEVTESEILNAFKPVNMVNKAVMHSTAKQLIDLNKSRKEKDNISVLLIKAE